MKGYLQKLIVTGVAAAIMTSAACSDARAMGGSIQTLGGWWDAGDSDSTYALGLRGTLGETWGLDLGWMRYGEGDDIEFEGPISGEKFKFGGIEANVFDLGLRYTFLAEIYLGGGLSYYDFDYELNSLDAEWGVYGLVGWSFGGEHLRAFIEGMYRYTSSTIKYDDGFLGTYERDVDQDGFGANVGIMYRF